MTTVPYDDLESALHYRFKDKAAMRRALTHSSVSASKTLKDYERLEFLGDRVLGLVVSELLLRHFPNETVGAIAKRHSALVRGVTLARIAADINLSQYVSVVDSERDENGHVINTGILEDVCEALIAVIYRDGGMDAVRAVIERLWEPYLNLNLAPPIDAKSRLQEWAQGRRLPLPIYRLIKRSGPDHAPEFIIHVEVDGYDPVKGIGASKKEAEKLAAEEFYQTIVDVD